MSYRPISAGHGAKEASQTIEQVDISELVLKAKAWLEGRRTVNAAIEETASLSVSAKKAGLLAVHPILQDHPQYVHLGLFISELWSRCQETVITYTHCTPKVWDLGYKLPQHKILINNGTMGRWTGFGVEGVLINNGSMGDWSGAKATGTIINNGTMGDGMGCDPTGILIGTAPGSVGETFRNTGIALERYEQNGPLKRYVDILLQLAERDPDAIETAFGNGRNITADIMRLIDWKWWRFWRRTPRPREAPR